MMRIGEFSCLAKTTVKTLRFYDEIGLFKPEFVDNNGYRYYSIEQLRVLQTIVDLRSFDMPIDDIRKILNGEDIIKVLESRQKEIKENIAKSKQSLTQIKGLLATAEKGEFMKQYKAKEITLPKCTVYYRHGIIDSMADLVPFILEAGAECQENNPTLKCITPDYCYVVYGAKEYKEKDVEVEYAQAVEKTGKASENIKFKDLPSEKAISVMHKGSYSKLGEAYAYAVNWVKEKGYEIANQIRERYIDGCWNKESENDYLTEIQIPIK